MEKCAWKMGPVSPVIPAMMPRDLKEHTSLLALTGEMEALPRASVRHGNWMNLANVKKMCEANGVAKPTEGTGKVGKNGKRSILKRDWVLVLLRGLFPTMDQEEMNNLLRKFMGTWDPSKMACPTEVMDCVEGLDHEEQDESYVKRVKDLARKARDASAEVQGRGLLK